MTRDEFIDKGYPRLSELARDLAIAEMDRTNTLELHNEYDALNWGLFVIADKTYNKRGYTNNLSEAQLQELINHTVAQVDLVDIEAYNLVRSFNIPLLAIKILTSQVWGAWRSEALNVEQILLLIEQELDDAANGSGVMSRAIEVMDVTQGSYSDGDVIPINTPVTDVIERMLQVDTPAVYDPPGASLNLSGAANTVEAGAVIDPTLTPVFDQDDAGAVSGYVLERNGTSLVSAAGLTAHTDSSLAVGDETFTFLGSISYAEGPVKLSRAGNPTPGNIAAGVVTASVAITGKRYLFAGFNTTATTSAAIRALTPRTLGPVNGSAFTINIPAGTTQVVFAYPADLRDVSSVIYVEGLNAQVKPIFVQSTVAVEGANAFTPINYRVYVYTPDGPFQNPATYNVTI